MNQGTPNNIFNAGTNPGQTNSTQQGSLFTSQPPNPNGMALNQNIFTKNNAQPGLQNMAPRPSGATGNTQGNERNNSGQANVFSNAQGTPATNMFNNASLAQGSTGFPNTAQGTTGVGQNTGKNLFGTVNSQNPQQTTNFMNNSANPQNQGNFQNATQNQTQNQAQNQTQNQAQNQAQNPLQNQTQNQNGQTANIFGNNSLGQSNTQKTNIFGNQQGNPQGNLQGNLQGNQQGNPQGNPQGNQQVNVSQQAATQPGVQGGFPANTQGNNQLNLQGNPQGNQQTGGPFQNNIQGSQGSQGNQGNQGNQQAPNTFQNNPQGNQQPVNAFLNNSQGGQQPLFQNNAQVGNQGSQQPANQQPVNQQPANQQPVNQQSVNQQQPANLFQNNALNNPQGTLFQNNPQGNQAAQGNQAVQGNQQTHSQGQLVNGQQGEAVQNPLAKFQQFYDLYTGSFFDLNEDYKSRFMELYESIHSISDIALRHFDQREQNQTISKNFRAIQPTIAVNKEAVLKQLDSLQKQQNEVETALNAMVAQMGENHYTHDLVTYLGDYEQMRASVVELQNQFLETSQWKEPSHEQMRNIFENLNHVENELNMMDQTVDVYLGDYALR